ncbi:pyruvate dehydrogenase (acetyl-transferring) E1 component subunit alpha [bacterium]|nr:pyruvate dehydrogenase (acetyl-transferring) E1 component subunit alpha [bacterium]MBU1071714.1 pyruvate dehydrogenase (acetyl-transferring) E1 component subunit alpha [bacterium]
MPLQEVASFQVSRLEILDEQGNVDKELEPDLTRDQLIELYRHMVWGRITDERMLNLQRQGRIGTFGPSTGQEAAHCAPMFAATDRDWFVGAFREHGARLMRGESLLRQLVYFNGYEEGNVNEEGSSPRNLPISVIVGAQPLHAVGLAYAMRLKGEPESAALAFMGDGATSEGDFHEALNFASVWNLPVVFVVQNNQWAISVPRAKQTRSGTIAQKAIAYGMHGVQVDGNDALAMYVATREALERGRRGEGPTLIEAVTYRLMMHTTADDQYKYRTEEEEKVWWQRDPLLRFRKYLEARKFWSEKDQAALEEELKARMDEQIKAFEAKTDFPPEAPFDHVFGTRHDTIEEQKAAFLAELGKEAGHA